MALQWVTETSLRGPKGDKGDPGDPAPGGSYLSGPVPAGQATVSITHNLGTRDVVVMVRDTASYAYVPIANDAPDEDTVRLQFAEPPTTGQYRYVLFAAIGDPVQGPIAPTAHAPTHAAGGTDPLSPDAIGAAVAGHSHPYASNDHTHPPALRGPWVQTRGFTALSFGPADNRAVGDLTVPALGYDWLPFCSARYQIRSDLARAVPLEVAHQATGAVVSRGISGDSARAGWYPVHTSPVLGDTSLRGNTSHTFVLRAAITGAWVESNTGGDPSITVYALPV